MQIPIIFTHNRYFSPWISIFFPYTISTNDYFVYKINDPFQNYPRKSTIKFWKWGWFMKRVLMGLVWDGDGNLFGSFWVRFMIFFLKFCTVLHQLMKTINSKVWNFYKKFEFVYWLKNSMNLPWVPTPSLSKQSIKKNC